MSRYPGPFTKASLRRALDVAKEKDARLVLRPDGTMIFERQEGKAPETAKSTPTVEADKEVVL
jgi:hypothetical protein